MLTCPLVVRTVTIRTNNTVEVHHFFCFPCKVLDLRSVSKKKWTWKPVKKSLGLGAKKENKCRKTNPKFGRIWGQGAEVAHSIHSLIHSERNCSQKVLLRLSQHPSPYIAGSPQRFMLWRMRRNRHSSSSCFPSLKSPKNSLNLIAWNSSDTEKLRPVLCRLDKYVEYYYNTMILDE